MYRLGLLAIITVSIFSLPSLSQAKDYFVSPKGKEKSLGTHIETPTSPSAALKKVKSGDTVIFLDGTYENPIHLTVSGKPGAPITLRAYAGAVPVFKAPKFRKIDGLSAEADVSNYVIDGLWFEEWGEAGIGLGWDHKVSGVVIRNCVADLNGRNGFAPYYASDVTIVNNIASRNGWAPDSWSSNFDIFAVHGKKNKVSGNVSFHGVDTSSHRSDGNGYILDLSTNEGSAVFENNIGFLNGGSCISIADSGGAQLIGNTCYGNAQYGADFLDEIVLANTCRPGTVSRIPLNGMPYTFSGLVLRNNLVAPFSAAKKGIAAYSKCGEKNYSSDQNSVIFPAVSEITSPDPSAFGIDPRNVPLQFDFKCIKRETNPSKNKFSFWKFAPDLEYIKGRGGISKCFVRSQ